MRTLIFLLTLLLAVSASAQPSIFTGGVVNAASFAAAQPVAPGSLIAIFGNSLADSLLSSDTVPWSANLGGASVSVNGAPIPLSFVSTGQINAQMPWNALPPGVTSGTVNVSVQNTHGASVSVPVNVGPAAPGIFSIPAGAGYAVAVNNRDGSVAAPPGAISGIVTHPAAVGDVLILYATGLGAVDNTPANGAASLDMVRNTLAVPTVLIGGNSAQVLFHGLSPQFPGVNQINLVVPQVSSGSSVPIQLQMGNITSTNQVVIAIQ
ncbi:MAG: hypothetical protein JO307_24410 [Bryobacterales bacterium]|nr:hypothetical protein [Bryobacterales bacterium]MBV9398232.1 hypothetical protein [Bryobacterales bacterium]